MKVVGNTESICPLCYQDGKINKINAQLIEDQKKIWMFKKCSIHGFIKEVYFDDEDIYNKWMTYKVTGKPVPEIKTSLFNEPPLYEVHLSFPVLTNIIVTNRCNLRCSDCSLNALNAGYIYEPQLEQLKELIRQAKEGTPLGSFAIQIAGGEPTLRNDLFEIINYIKKIGFSHLQIQTNGILLAENIDYCHRLKKEGVDTIYMKFNGVTVETNPLLLTHIKALNNLKNANLDVVLEPILIRSRNVHEAGKIIRFALDHLDAVRGVHFVPQMFYGGTTKITEDEHHLQQVDFIHVITEIEREFSGIISREDFYPIPLIDQLSQLVEMMSRELQIRFTAHPLCGASTFLYMKDGKPLPITRFLNVDTIIQFITDQKKKKGLPEKLRFAGALVKNIDSFIEKEKAPHGFDLRRIAKDIVIGGDNYAMREFHRKTLFIGFMSYQNAWNLDIDQLRRCVVQYSTTEGLLPYCMYHGLGYGEKIQKKHSISIVEWEKKTNQRLVDDLFKNTK